MLYRVLSWAKFAIWEPDLQEMFPLVLSCDLICGWGTGGRFATEDGAKAGRLLLQQQQPSGDPLPLLAGNYRRILLLPGPHLHVHQEPHLAQEPWRILDRFLGGF